MAQVRRAVCPGSFDPVTLGHLDVITRAAELFDEVIVAVGANPGKNTGLFTVPERVELLREACAGLARVRVDTFSGLLVDYCASVDAGVVVKGLRSPTDYGYELPMADLNRRMAGLETVFLASGPQWTSVSSSLVRDIARFGGDVSEFVPQPVVAALEQQGGISRD